MKTNLFIIIALFFIIDEASAVTIWNKKENFPGLARHRTTGFNIGNIGYMGLGHYNSGAAGNVYHQDFWAYDPSTDSWTQIADFSGGLRYHAADFVYGNKAYVGTGQSPTGWTTDFWEYDPITNFWTPIANFPSSARRGSVAFTLGEFGFVGCGQGSIGNDFYAYHVSTNAWYTIASMPGPSRSSSCAFTIGDKAYVGTGAGLSNDFYEYKPATNSWIQKSDVGPNGRAQAHGFSLMGKGYILTGLSSSTSGWNSQEMFEYEPLTDTWTQLDDFPGLGRRYLDGFEINERAYMGMGTNGTNFNDLWEFNPANALSIENNEDITVNTYPNPAVDYVTFDLGGSAIALNENIELYFINIQGQLIMKRLFTDEKLEIDLTSFASGTYIYIIRMQTDAFANGKIQIVK